MLGKNCMTAAVRLASPEMTLHQAAQRMKEIDCGMLPVGDHDRLVGMVTDRDITIRAVAEGKDPKTTPVGDVMSKKVLYCYDDQTIEEIAKNMGENGVRRLPVLNRQKRLVGIISLSDIVKAEEGAEHAKLAYQKIVQKPKAPARAA